MIKNLSLKNFMSYANTDIPFSSGVNFICGPNGAGKSSILVAVALALGLSRTERGNRLSDLIRWGCDRASIRLTLDNRPTNGSRSFPEFDKDEIVIERMLNRSGSYPIKIDGIPCTKEELTELISSQGINPDNMLIIMQQDMVEEFSLLSPPDKLAMLEEVIEFQSYRQDLLKASEELDALLDEEKQTRRILDGSSRRVTEWERLYERYQRKRKLEDNLEDLTAEALWAKVSEAERELQQLESRKGERSQELVHLQSQMSNLERRIEERSSQVDDQWRILGESKDSLIEVFSSHSSAISRMESIKSRLGEEKSELERLRRSIERDELEMEKAVRRIDGLREQSEGGETEEELASNLSRIEDRISQLVEDERLRELERSIASKKMRIDELKRRRETIEERLEYPFGRELGAVAQDIDSIDTDGPVFGPLYQVIRSDGLPPHVIRALYGDRILTSFVTTTERDKERVLQVLKERGIDSHVYLVSNSALVLLEERYLPQEEGVIDWVASRIEAPGHVEALLHRVVGDVVLVDEDTDVQRVSRTLGMPVVSAEGERAGLMTGLISGRSGKSADAEGELRAELDAMNEESSEVEREIARLSRELESAKAEKAESFTGMLREATLTGSKLELLRAERMDNEALLRREAERIRISSEALIDFKERLLGEGKRLVDRLEEELEPIRNSIAKMERKCSLEQERFLKERSDLEKQLQVYYELKSKRMLMADEINSTKSAIKDMEYRVSRQQGEIHRLTEEAKELSPKIPNPRDLLELEKEISGIRGSLGELSDVPDEIEGVYKMYLKDFQELKETLQNVIEKREEMQAELRRGLRKWREIIEGYLEEINRDFNEILKEIGARGHVKIVNNDVRKVGLDITVGFEGKEEISISTLGQSGGEKSLSTMAFLLALQRQVKSPFRAVDEYDVHLDPVNRDQVTHLLRSAVEGDSKQYIAITPSHLSEADLEEAGNVIVVQSIHGKSQVGSLVMEA